MKFAPLLIALTLILSVSCSNKKGKTNVQFGRMFLNGAPTFTGGLGIFGKNDLGNYFTYTLVDDSTIPPMDIPNGNWTFWAVGWTSANKLEGITKCGTTNALLEGGDVGISMILNQSNCGNAQLAEPPFINVDQFHPVVVTSCYLQTIVDDTTVCDGSYKGEHRSFRFKIDTVSNFGALPSPQPIISNCFDESSSTSGSSTTTVTIPAGSAAGVPLNVIIEAYPNTGCTGAASFFKMPKGFFDPNGPAQTFAGSAQTKVYLETLVPTSGPINSIAYMNLVHSAVTTTSVDVTFDFLNDDNLNSTADLQICNNTTTPGCTPSGANVMAKVGNTYAIYSFAHGGSPGQEIVYNVFVTDSDGVSAALPNQSFFVPVTAPSSLVLNTPVSSPSNITSPIIDVLGTVAGGMVSVHTFADCSDAALGSTAGAASTTPVALSGLTDGTYTFYAKQTINGVQSNCTSGGLTYTLDTAPPVDPTALAFIAASPTNDNTPDITASSLTVGDSIKFYTDAGCTTPNVGPLTISSTTEIFSLATLVDGAYNIYTKVYDAAGNGSTCLSVGATTVDTTAPVMPSGLTSASAYSNITTPSINVTHSDPSGSVSIYSDSGCSVLLGTAPANGSNVAIASSTLVDGSYFFYADQTDAAGNKSPCSSASFNYTLDTIPPSILSITRVDPTPATSGTINYLVNFSEPLLVPPDASDFVHTYLSGGVTDAIGTVTGGGSTFTVPVTISGGDGDVRLDLNDSNFSLMDQAGNYLTSTVFSGGEIYTIDNTGPQFVSISSTNGTYLEIENVDISVTFNENTFASGSILNLTGGRTAAYFSGDGTPTITYRYTVGALDNLSTPLDYQSSLPISGGSILDTLGNVSGSVIFPTPGSAGSLSILQNILLLGSARYQWGGTGNETKSYIARKDATGEVFQAFETTDATIWGAVGATDIVLSKFDPFGNLVNSIVIGGTLNETLGGIIYNPNDDSIYVIGNTTSTDLYGGGLNGSNDFFVGNYSTNLAMISENIVAEAGPQPEVQALTIDTSTNYLYLGGYFVAGAESVGAGCTTAATKAYITRINLSTATPNVLANCTIGGGTTSAVLSLTSDNAGTIFAAGFASGPSDAFVGVGSGTDTDMHIWKYSSDLTSILAMYRHDTVFTDNSATAAILYQNGYIFVTGDTNGASFGTYTAGSTFTDYYVYSADATDLVTSALQYQRGVTGLNTWGLGLLGDPTLGEITVVGLTEGALALGSFKASAAVPDIFLDTLDDVLLTSVADYQFDDTNPYEQVPNSATVYSSVQSAVMSDDGLQIWLSGQAVGNVFDVFQGGAQDSFLLMITAP